MANGATAQATFKELLYLCNKARGLAETSSHDEIAQLRQAVNTLADALQLLAVQMTQGERG